VNADGTQVEARGVSTPAFAAEPETGPKTGPKTSTEIALAGTTVELRSSGAMFWPERSLLCVGDLHLGRAERLAREGGDLLPSYESIATLDRLEAEIAALNPRLVICLGDSFDELAAARTLSEAVPTRIGRLAAGRRWIWVAGDHDPGPVELPGTHLAELRLGLLSFRHIALPRLAASGGEVSAHYHPKARVTRRGARISRRCFLADGSRAILPAFGTSTEGLDARDRAFEALLDTGSQAFLLGVGITVVARERLG
jgi:DNA ligase-associated metallophosphoesterase